MQANVGRGHVSHNLALHLAHENNIDILLLQEPWIFHDLTTKKSLSHPGFQSFSPLSTWSTRPRVFTYVRKTKGLRASQTLSDSSPDLLQICILNRNSPNISIWNVYNAPPNCINAGSGLQTLLNSSETPYFVGGDFNLKHPSWDSSSVHASPHAMDLLQWVSQKNLSLLNPTETPTHRCGGTLDLAFCTQVGATCTIRADLHTTSDHETLISTILLAGLDIGGFEGRLRYDSRDEKLFLTLLGTSQNVPQIFSSLDAEDEANDIVQSIQTALLASCPRSKQNTRGTPWWNEDCKIAARRYHTARRRGPSDLEKMQLRAAVRRAKKEFWQSKIEKANSLTDAYKIVKWHNCGPKFQTPPLREMDGSNQYYSPELKALLFRNTLLSRHLEVEDICDSSPTVASRLIKWEPISEAEVFSATCQVSSTSPGEDELTAPIIRLAWNTHGKRITNLFDRCLHLGVHPKIFKQAKVIILPKSGRRDRSLPSSYRPIALLSCLGKGLERLLARRMSYCASKYEILTQNQCGAIRQRSAVDLKTALICDIRKALLDGKVAGIVTVDVKGAFDGVLCNRLLHRLRTQRWPETLVKWVKSFFQERSARIILDQTTSEPFPILCGLPQGPPISPILFLLYVEPFLRLSRGRFGYADDGCFLATARTLEDCGRKLESKLNQTLQWGYENGVIFDSAKTELQYFHNKRKYTEPSLHTGTYVVNPKDHVRWLGVIFDRKLNFKDQVRRACQRARVVTDHVKRLSNTIRGINPSIIRTALQGTALASLFYGSEVWYGPKTSAWVINQIQVTINQAARAVLPVYKTTPTAALLRETGWGPAITWLNRFRDRLAVRIAATDPKHPLRRRWNSPHFKWIRQRQDLELSCDSLSPPWEQTDTSIAKLGIGAVGRVNGTAEHKKWIKTREHKILDFSVYSDGSVDKDGSAGAAYCIFRGPSKEMAHGFVPLGQTVEIYDAEIHGALEGLRAALDHPMAKFATDLIVYLDNEEAALRLHTGVPTPTSSGLIAEFQTLRKNWETRARSRVARAGKVIIRWIPSHTNIKENDRVDSLAKTACNMPTTRTQASIARARRLIKERYETEISAYWNTNAPERYKRLGIGMTGSPPQELRILTRKNLGNLLAARSGHGNFAAYHRRFKHTDADTNCSCGQERSPEHPFYCRKLRQKRPPRPLNSRNREEDIKWILGTIDGARAFQRWCTEYSPYE